MSSLAKTSRPFRYATVKPLVKKQFPIKGLHDPSPTSGSVASSVKWLAVGQGAKGSVAILPTKFKKWTRSDTPPTINAHGNELADLAFSPFNDDMLVTAGRDNVVKLWTVPEGGLSENLTQAKATFADFDGGANSVRFHPSAEHLLAAGAKNKLSIIDLGKQSEAYTFKLDGGGKDIMSLGWNYDGSLLSALGKNGVVSVFDPRSSGDDILSKATKLSNITKPQHSFFIGKEGKGHLALLGLDKGQRPTFNLFDPRDLSKPVLNQGLELSNGYMLPLYDIDTEVLLLTIRGSQTLTAFDVSSPGSGKPPALFQFYQYGCDTGFKGGCLQAKRACNFVKCEIDRIYLLGADVIQPYSFRVPRKVRGFHAELFPDTADSKAALSADEWLGGKNKDPMLTSIEKLVGQAPVQSQSPLETKEIKHSTSSDDTSKATVSASGNKPEQKITEITYRATATRMSIDRGLARSTFQHVSGTEPNGKDVTWFDLQTSESLALCQNICINRKFIAVPWRAVGGSALAIMRTDKPGRVTGQTPCVRGHKTQIVTFDLSRLDDHLLVTASTDGVAKLWKLPPEGLTSDLTEPQAEFATEGKGVLARFHPYVDNCLVTASHGFDGSFVQFWDIKEGKPVIELKGLWGSEQILDLAFDPSSKHIATTSKDKKLRIIDPRAKKVVCEMSPQEGERDTRVLWINAARVLTTGFASGGRRLASVWSISEPQKALKSEELTKNNSMPIPHYDEDTSLLWIANNGSMMVQTYIVTPSAPFIELLGEYKSMADTTGQAFVHKTSVDVKKVEVAKSLKLSKDKIIPISWTVPRKRLDFFQDDVFPPTRALKAVYSLSEYINDADKEPEYVSLCPAGMTDLSKAPKQELTDRQVRYQKQLLAKDAPKPKGILGHTSTEEVRDHFRGISKDLPSSNRWDAKPDKNSKDVEDSEWD